MDPSGVYSQNESDHFSLQQEDVGINHEETAVATDNVGSEHHQVARQQQQQQQQQKQSHQNLLQQNDNDEHQTTRLMSASTGSGPDYKDQVHSVIIPDTNIRNGSSSSRQSSTNTPAIPPSTNITTTAAAAAAAATTAEVTAAHTGPIIATDIDSTRFGPDYKDQANSVAISRRTTDMESSGSNTANDNSSKNSNNTKVKPVLYASDGNHIQSSNGRNPVNTATQNNNNTNQDRGAGPTFKDQVNNSTDPVVAPMPSSNDTLRPSSNHTKSTNRINSHTAVSNNNNVDDGIIPIVHGVLMNDSEVFVVESNNSNTHHRSDHTNETITTAANSSNNQSHPSQNEFNNGNNDNENRKGKGINAVPPKSNDDNMKFWVKIIFGAIFLNTILVAAMITGIFCGIGACTGGNASYSLANEETQMTKIPTRAPVTQQPSVVPSALPTSILPTSFDSEIMSIVPTISSTTRFVAPSVGAPFGIPVPEVSAPPISTPISAPAVLSTNTPATNLLPDPTPINFDTSTPTIVTTTSAPTIAPQTNTPATNAPQVVFDKTEGSRSRSSIIVYIVIPAVLIEFVLVFVCLYRFYQRKKKLQQVQQQDEDADGDSQQEPNASTAGTTKNIVTIIDGNSESLISV